MRLLILFLLSLVTLGADATSYWAANLPVDGSALAAPYIEPPYSCQTNYYVTKAGSNGNNGTSLGTAWLTVQHAVDMLSFFGGTHEGVCVNVGDGTYDEIVYAGGLEGNADTATGYLVFRSANLHGAMIQVPVEDALTDFAASLHFDEASYLIIDGFELIGRHLEGAVEGGVVVNTFGDPGHHIKVINNLVHDHGGSGISVNHSDYVEIQGNKVWGTSKNAPFHGSGISLFQAVASDSESGFHNRITDNIVFENTEDDTTGHTDGNGIILDDFRNTQGGSSHGNYAEETLVARNLIFTNGGGGIHIFLSNGISVFNNTVFNSFLDTGISATWRGGIDALYSASCTFKNNISVANALIEANNTAFADAAGDDGNLNNVWENNLSFNGNDGQASILITGSPSEISEEDGNILGSDPLFADPLSGDFTLHLGSPAIGAGQFISGFSAKNPPDMGAFQIEGQEAPAPATTFSGVSLNGVTVQ